METIDQQFPQDYFKYDTQNYERYLKNYAEDLRTSYNRSFRNIVEKINFTGKLLIVGSSWSINAAKIVQDFLQAKLNIIFVDSYDETVELTNKDVLIALSYTGNSEEASTWLKYARRASAQTIIITTGGRLAEDSFNNPVIDLSKGLPSRSSTFTIIGTLLRLFEDANLISSQVDEVQNTVNFLRDHNLSQVSQDLSEKIQGVIPLIYSTNQIMNASHKFKRLINATAKTTAFFNQIPGAEYYEAEGFSMKNAQFYAIILSSSDELSRVKKKTTVFKNTLQQQEVSVTELNIKGTGLIKQATVLLIGDLTSYYLALRYKKDPLVEEITTKLKKDTGTFI